MSSVRDAEPDEPRAAVSDPDGGDGRDGQDGQDSRDDAAAEPDDAWWSASPGGAIPPPRDPASHPGTGVLEHAAEGTRATPAEPSAGNPAPPPGEVVGPYEEPPPEPPYVPPPYAPPPSPAYAEPGPTAPPRPRRPVAPPEPEAAPRPDPSAPRSRIERSHRAGGRLLVIGLVLVAIAVGSLVIEATRSTGPDRYVFGTVATSSGSVTVQTGVGGSDATTLAPGDDVTAGSVVETTEDASAVVDLAGGGVVRVEGDARVVFIDLAADPQTGEMSERAEPVVQIDGGRVWLNPAGSGPLEVQVPGGTLASTGAPMAVDCGVVCSIEAPAGGVTVTTRAGNEASPAAGEVLTITSDNGFAATFADAPARWIAENIDADRAAGVAVPDTDDVPGIRSSAQVGGTFALTFDVVSEPRGDAIPEALTYPDGGDYAVTVLADATTCDGPPCTVPLSGLRGGAGSAEVADGSVTVTFTEEIDCFDQGHTSVVVPAIGATTVEATLTPDEVAYEGGRWVATSLVGDGEVTASLTKRCNPSDVLGSATSDIAVTVTAAD